MAAESRVLISAIKKALRERANPAKAGGMQAYMKSEMPYRGVQTPEMRRACREVYPHYPLPSFDAWRDTILALWRGARYREERYAALELARARPYAPFRTLRAVPMFEEIVVTRAWWDYVDYVASHHLGDILRRQPAGMKRRMRAWSKSPDMWKRHSSILCQLGFKDDIDLDLLYECIERSASSDEFFLQKAIGWALRNHAWTDPQEVIRYVRKNRASLRRLSKREALKNVIKQGLLDAVP